MRSRGSLTPGCNKGHPHFGLRFPAQPTGDPNPVQARSEDGSVIVFVLPIAEVAPTPTADKFAVLLEFLALDADP